MESTTFDGWPVEAPALLAEIAADNRAERWPELREGHAAVVRGPTLALAAALAGEFGPVRVFRPHVTRRFRPDAPPLRTDTGGVATSPGGCGLAVVLSADALTVTVGHWAFDRDQRSRYRAAVDAVESGEGLAGLLRRLAARRVARGPRRRAAHPAAWLAGRPSADLAGAAARAAGGAALGARAVGVDARAAGAGAVGVAGGRAVGGVAGHPCGSREPDRRCGRPAPRATRGPVARPRRAAPAGRADSAVSGRPGRVGGPVRLADRGGAWWVGHVEWSATLVGSVASGGLGDRRGVGGAD